MSIDYYEAAEIERMAAKFSELDAKHFALQSSIHMHKFSTQKGEEFAKQGFLRRSAMLWRCVQNTFEKIPPELDGKPSSDDTKDATIFLHCFMINVFGACDTLAWILVHEKIITKSDGSDLPQSWVGIRKGNKSVRDKLSNKMIEVLSGFEDWFKHIDDFRHSLAHRIPLYVPPYMIPPDKVDDYKHLRQESLYALVRGELDVSDQLKKEQHDLGFFRPYFVHSLAEKSPAMVIHPQMLADFGAVLELGEATLGEL